MTESSTASTAPAVHTERQDGVLVATLARPPVNALDDALVDALDAAIDQACADATVKVLHLRSAHKVFCAGADLALMQRSIASDEGLQAMLALVRRMQRVAARLESAPVVTLAELGGAALGGGFEMALGCDLRIAACEARLGLPEAGLGLLAAAGGTQRLTRLVGPGLARRLILSAEVVDGRTALELGLVQWAVPRAELGETARALAQRIAALPRQALAAAKPCIAAAVTASSDGFELELAHTRELYRHPDTRARVTAFLARDARPTPPSPSKESTS
ncbi:MAG: enoyl-CoA hydratase/isomerase family protein [Aquabacterium sp.]|nr:enoyl-CoA hydratase/isomerase family protein [Aquabacterium sp.]